jgi:AraC family transcriptional regulator of adaptative response / DNA-3-methyladenine glycosylase II
LPGVGQWTAQYIAMRELREPDAFPVGDIGLKRALARLAGQPLTSRELLEKAERWRPWRTYAQHLWASKCSLVERRRGRMSSETRLRYDNSDEQCRGQL